jgi:hypothetical protein
MAGRGTWLLGIALTALAVVAVVDALRSEARQVVYPPESTPAAAPTERRSAPRPVAGGGPAGVLYYTNDDCVLEAVRLPALEPMTVPRWRNCRFVLSPDADSVSEPPSGWDPVGDFLFRLEDGWIVVTSGHEPVGERFAGAAAAWRPDGTLTYAARGAVREWPTGRVVLSPDDLAQAVLAHPDVPDHGHVLPVIIRELAWLEGGHAVVVVSAVVSGVGETILAFLEGRRLTAVQMGGGTRLSDLRVSPQSGFVSVRSGDDFFLLSRRGDLLPTPILSGFRAIAWSPDERWAAVATDRGISVFRTGESSVERRLPILARDLAWRGGSVASAGP